MGLFLGNPFVTFPATGGFSPSDISNLEAWYDANDVYNGSNPSNGDSIGGSGVEWMDKSGNGYDLVQATGTRQPKFYTGILNGLPGILFDDVANQYLSAATASISQDITVCIVFQPDDVGATKYLYDGLTDRVMSRIAQSAGPKLQIYADSLATVDGFTPDTSAHYAIIKYSGSASKVNIDGTEVDSSINPNTGSWDDFIIGASTSADTSSDYSGYMFEIIVYSKALTTTEYTQLETYFGRWGL